jgi:hypothetical protein
MNNQIPANGRVNLQPVQPSLKNLFDMYDKIPANQCAGFRDPTIGIWDDSQLSKLFFSKENIQIIQNGIRAGVYKKSKGEFLVGQQDCNCLKVIMRSIFLQTSKNTGDIRSQITDLNNRVLEYCIHQVHGEAQGYMNYLRDVTSISVPLEPPAMDYTPNRRTHKMPEWF